MQITTTDFTTTFTVDRTPKEVFDAIIDIRGWWSEEVEGSTKKVGGEFLYHFKDVHICKMKVLEIVPHKKVVWLVVDNYFNFTKDKQEWKDTKLSFEIRKNGDKTQVQFTHIGLVPEYECFNICTDAWSNYIQKSLYDLITTGKGQPNPKEGGFNQALLEKHFDQKPASNDLHISFTVDATPHEVFEKVNSVTKWWTEELEGSSQKLNDEFVVRFFDDIHVSKQRLIEVIPDKKVVWLVTESNLNFIEDKQEWTNTKIVFEITQRDGKTQLDFTHMGLVPERECFDDCTQGWNTYVKGSLYQLITKGKGKPELK